MREKKGYWWWGAGGLKKKGLGGGHLEEAGGQARRKMGADTIKKGEREGYAEFPERALGFQGVY